MLVFSSIVTRLAIIVILALTMMVVASLTLSYLTAWRAHETGTFVPLPEQVAGIVKLLDETLPERRNGVLQAINGNLLHAEIKAVKPDASSHADAAELAPGLNFLFQRYNEVLRGRYVSAAILRSGAGDNRITRMFTWAVTRNQVLRLVIGLNDGAYLLIEAQSELGQRIFGIPPGFLLTLMSSAIALVAILALLREARPVRQLSAAVVRFAATAEMQALPQSRAREVRSLIEAFDLMQQRIITLLEGRTFIIGAVSHDLKTYVTRLRLRVESIDDDEKRKGAITDIEEMSALIDDAQDFTKHALVSPCRKELDILALVRTEISRFGEVSIALDAGNISACRIDGDAVALRRLIANLIGNAVKFANTIRVSLIRAEKGLEFIVDDDGPGIPVPERTHIFEPFYRLEKSRSRKTGGAGLGLAIADEIVRAHGGTIKAGSSPMGGARIIVGLPCSVSTV